MNNIKVYKEPCATGHINDSQIVVEWRDEKYFLLTSTGDMYDGELSAYDEHGNEVLISDPEIIEIVTAEIDAFETKALFDIFKDEPPKWNDGIYTPKDNKPIPIYKDGEYYKYIPTSERGLYHVYNKDENFIGTMPLTVAEVRASKKDLEG